MRNPSNWTYDSIPASILLYRGYTFHEHLDEFGLINMNGRAYDPIVGRFLNPDPVLQNPSDIQNYNRYSYCLNNPLKYTDPSGYMSVGWQSMGVIINEMNTTLRMQGYQWYLNNVQSTRQNLSYFQAAALVMGVSGGAGGNSILMGMAAKIASVLFSPVSASGEDAETCLGNDFDSTIPLGYTQSDLNLMSRIKKMFKGEIYVGRYGLTGITTNAPSGAKINSKGYYEDNILGEYPAVYDPATRKIHISPVAASADDCQFACIVGHEFNHCWIDFNIVDWNMSIAEEACYYVSGRIAMAFGRTAYAIQMYTHGYYVSKIRNRWDGNPDNGYIQHWIYQIFYE